MSKHDPLNWIARHLDVQSTSYGAFFYGQIEQWSPGRLPGINCVFDPANKAHFTARGAELDFAVVVEQGRILDFGPGDGWPALRVAPMVESIVGVDASVRRVEVCRQNAQQAGIGNAEFVLVKPGDALPFDDNSFDGVVASWSLEETPDLGETLRELLRVLRPDGKMRFERVPLSFFAREKDTGMYVGDALDQKTIILIGKPDMRDQKVRFTSLLLDMPRADFRALFECRNLQPVYDAMTDDVLSELSPHVVAAGSWETRNPDCDTWLKWLRELGCRHAQSTYGGGWFAERYFDRLPLNRRPTSEQEVDTMLRPLVEVAVVMEAPKSLDAPITAIK